MQQAAEDVAALRRTFGCFPSGVTAVCALIDGAPAGMAASSFTSVSLDPPLVSICVQNTSATWPRLRRAPRLGLSVLAENHNVACMRLSRKEGDRFDGVDWEPRPDGGVFVLDATAWLDCRLHDEIPAGDHLIVLLEVLGLLARPETPPLVFHTSRFRRLAPV
ncbi:flavin reductase family protein [Actinomadura soli]|uniref:Flavin reductase family protein n=1 Tax=Actinomadura soli TaxID=2508997 RepID=A0A5C4JE36_9ACTN|nr:flavin reductase family protein [Actinomadura soli]TMR01577.1 flavin reductase family protein [Actinomadura soli]